MPERDLRRISREMEHGLARKQSTLTHTIDAADQLIFLPTLNTVGATGFVQAQVGLDKLLSDPYSSRLVVAHASITGRNAWLMVTENGCRRRNFAKLRGT